MSHRRFCFDNFGINLQIDNSQYGIHQKIDVERQRFVASSRNIEKQVDGQAGLICAVMNISAILLNYEIRILL